MRSYFLSKTATDLVGFPAASVPVHVFVIVLPPAETTRVQAFPSLRSVPFQFCVFTVLASTRAAFIESPVAPIVAWNLPSYKTVPLLALVFPVESFHVLSKWYPFGTAEKVRVAGYILPVELEDLATFITHVPICPSVA